MLADADVKPRTDDSAEATGRLQQTEAMGADAQNIAGEYRQHGMVQAEPGSRRLHHHHAENDRARADIRETFGSLAKQAARCAASFGSDPHHQYGAHDDRVAQRVGVESPGRAHPADRDTGEEWADERGALPK